MHTLCETGAMLERGGPPDGHRRPVGAAPRRRHGPGYRRGRVADDASRRSRPSLARRGCTRRWPTLRLAAPARSATSPARGGHRGARRRSSRAGRRPPRRRRPVRPAGLGPGRPRRGARDPAGARPRATARSPAGSARRGRPGRSAGRSGGTRSACSSRATGSSPPTARSAATAATPGAARGPPRDQARPAAARRGHGRRARRLDSAHDRAPGDSHLEVR